MITSHSYWYLIPGYIYRLTHVHANMYIHPYHNRPFMSLRDIRTQTLAPNTQTPLEILI